MPLSNAERQKRHRQKLYSLARSAMTSDAASHLVAAFKTQASEYLGQIHSSLDGDEDPTGERRAQIEILEANLEAEPPSEQELEQEFFFLVEGVISRRRKALFPEKRTRRAKAVT